ncbi:MAG TPA: chemotaxis protein CheW [Mycobacteriales bacterium]|nr:chemotaxis protein CheW [Mycobacteriales bacterium]
MIPGYVMFRLGARTFALELTEVREIVRLEGLEHLPGTVAPMAGVIELRGNPLPVLDVRAGDACDGGDVLVMELDGDPVGVAVDQVLAVLSGAELPAAEEPPAKSLPAYVIGVRRSASGPVLLVDFRKLLDVAAEGWAEQLLDGTLAAV